MVTKEQLFELGFYASRKNQNVWFYDSWEYMYLINTCEFYNINDGVGEPQLYVNKVKDIDHLIEILESLGYNIEDMKDQKMWVLGYINKK